MPQERRVNANHAPCRAGIHSAASRSLFSDRFTVGSAIVRLPEAARDVSGYKVQWKSEESPIPSEVTITATSYNIIGLTNGTPTLPVSTR